MKPPPPLLKRAQGSLSFDGRRREIFIGWSFLAFRADVAALDLRGLSRRSAQVVQLAAASRAGADDFDTGDERTMDKKDSLHTLAISNSVEGDSLGSPRAFSRDAGASEALNALFAALFNDPDAALVLFDDQPYARQSQPEALA